MELIIPKIYVKWNYVFQVDTTTTFSGRGTPARILLASSRTACHVLKSLEETGCVAR